MKYCLQCGKEVYFEPRIAYDSRGIPLIRMREPVVTMCSECYSSGWRLDIMNGSTIQLIQEPKVSLLDLLVSEGEKE